MKAFVISTLAIALLMPAYVQAQSVAKQYGGQTPLQWSIKMADSQVARKADGMLWTEGGRKKWDYADNVFLLSIIKLGQEIKEPKYAQVADKVMNSFVKEDGSIQTYVLEDFNIDNINPGKTLLALYRTNQDDGFKHAINLLRSQVDTHPRTPSGGLWHKKIYPNQMWLDGLYMASPFRAEYAEVFNEPQAFDDIAKQIKLMAANSYDPKTGLFYHGWDESKTQDWANKETGRSPNFWGRAIGWYGMSIVDTLDYFPQNHPARPEIIKILNDLAAGMKKHQDASGLWYQVVDQSNREGNYLEATVSSMLAYTLAKGVNKGYLSKDYSETAAKAFTGIVEKLMKTESDGKISLTKCCSVAGLSAGRDGSFAYYIREPVVDNDMKGVGPFVMAGLEMQKLSGQPMAKP